jgi:ketosteroid isomerase-like protein
MLKALLVTASLAALAVATPVRAQDVKQELEKVRAAYQECVGKHDAACVASLYSKDGIQINPGGTFSDITKTYEDNFKNGTDSVVIRTDEVWPINNDLALARGEADISRTQDPPKMSVFWSGVYVREGGQMKIRMLTVGMKPPPPKEASAEKK